MMSNEINNFLMSRSLFQIVFLFILAFFYHQPSSLLAQSDTTVGTSTYVEQVTAATAATSYQYIAPRPGAQLVSAGTTIALRPGMAINAATLSSSRFTVEGTLSGLHTGEVRLADDDRTIIFVPTAPFVSEEKVTVQVNEGIRGRTGTAVAPMVFSFTIAPAANDAAAQEGAVTAARAIHDEAEGLPIQAGPTLPVADATSATWPYFTLPADLPGITVTVATEAAAEGYLFLSNFTLGGSGPVQPHLLIVNNEGIPIFYQQGVGTDFKQQPNGLLTYYSGTDQAFHALDHSYQIVDTYRAGNGYTIDFHEFLLLPNGHALFMIYDEQKVNMDDIVPGGIHAARVTGLVIQELDTEDNVVFEWRSWDHIPIIDTIVPITTTPIDYVHGNAIDVDYDGNLLVSSRHLNEITKISRETGDIIWRFGGKQNEFTFNDDLKAPFALQHDIRRLPNGSVTLFDNRTGAPSRGVEYWLNEIDKTASLIWSYESAPDAHAFIVGNVQRLANGNTLIGWGSTWPTVTEVNAANEKVFELTLARPQMSYRVHRYPWYGWPTWPATLVISEGLNTQLHYSWNGATDIYYYQIFGGTAPGKLEIIDLELATGFEETLDITRYLDRYCYFQVRPMGRDGSVGMASNEVYAGQTCKRIYLPSIMREN